MCRVCTARHTRTWAETGGGAVTNSPLFSRLAHQRPPQPAGLRRGPGVRPCPSAPHPPPHALFQPIRFGLQGLPVTSDDGHPGCSPPAEPAAPIGLCAAAEAPGKRVPRPPEPHPAWGVRLQGEFKELSDGAPGASFQFDGPFLMVFCFVYI